MNCIRLVLVCVKVKNCFKNPTMQSILLAQCYFWKCQTFVHKPFFFFFEHHLIWVIRTSANKTMSALKQKIKYEVVQAWTGQHRYHRCIWSDRCTFVLFSLKLFRVSGYRFFYRAKGKTLPLVTAEQELESSYFPPSQGKDGLAQTSSTQATLFHHGPLWEMSPTTRTPMVRLCSTRKATHYCPGKAAVT